MKSARSNLIYGDSNTGKTTQLYKIAKWITETTGGTIRLVTGDGGGYGPFEDSGLIDDKKVSVFVYKEQQQALAAIRLVGEGYWPRYDKRSGKPVIERSPQFLTDWHTANIACYMIEGITSISDQLLAHISEKEENVGFKHAWLFQEGDVSVGGLQPGHYGMVQTELYKLIVNKFGNLPVERIFWTALVEKGDDRRSTTVYGPKGAGKADTARIPSWFGDTLHLDSEEVDLNGKETSIRVAWYQDHNDKETGIKYLAKSRVLIDVREELEKKYPNGFVPLIGNKVGLDTYYKLVYKWNEEFKTKAKEIGEQE